MIITKELLEALKASDGSSIKICLNGKVTSKTRVQAIMNAVDNTHIDGVLDIGCGTHSSKIEQKLKEGKFLFSLLKEKYPGMMLIDNDELNVNKLKELDFSNVFYCDVVSNKSQAMVNAYFEDVPYVIILADKLEHFDNPVAFLQTLKKIYGKKQNKLVISVPNAYGYQRMQRLMTYGVEDINVDHRYMFTPMTILKVLIRAGLVPEEIDFAGYYDCQSNDVSSSLDDKYYMSGHTIVVTCSFK